MTKPIFKYIPILFFLAWDSLYQCPATAKLSGSFHICQMGTDFQQDLSKEWLFPKRIRSWRKSLLPYSSSSPSASSRLKCPLEDLLQFIHLILNEDLRFYLPQNDHWFLKMLWNAHIPQAQWHSLLPGRTVNSPRSHLPRWKQHLVKDLIPDCSIKIAPIHYERSSSCKQRIF